MKTPIDIHCSQPKCKGVCYSMPPNRLEAYLGDSRYQCEVCGTEYKFTKAQLQWHLSQPLATRSKVR